MTTNNLGAGVSRYIVNQDRQLAIVVFEQDRPPLDSELNLIGLTDFESRAETVRSLMPSGWLFNESNPLSDYKTDQSYSNLFYFGRNQTGEFRNLNWAVVNGWMVPVAGTRTGAPPLTPDDADSWNQIQLNPPTASTGGNIAEFVFLEVWQAVIAVDPAPPTVAPNKPQRGFVYRFGNVEAGFSNLPDDEVDPALGYETTKRVQLQYRIRVVQSINIAQNPEGFDPTLVFAQGALSAPSAISFTNMRGALGDPGLWRAGTGDPATFGTVDGYVYAVPICSAFRRNGAGFSDTGNLAGAFNRNSVAALRTDATVYTANPITPIALDTVMTVMLFPTIAGTILATMNSFGEAYFKLDDEIVRVVSVINLGPNFQVTINRGQLGSVIRSHLISTTMIPYTVRPDGLFADQIAITDIMDMRHSVADKFDYNSILKENFNDLLKGQLRTSWKRYGSTNSSGVVVFYGDRITDGSVFVGGLTRLDAPNGNRRVWSDASIVERFVVPVQVPNVASVIGANLTQAIAPYSIEVDWIGAAPGRGPGPTRLNGVIPFWWNGDSIVILKSDFTVGLPVSDADQIRFVLPSEDPDAVIVHFEGMITDPNGGVPASPPTTSPSATNTNIPIVGNRILKSGQGLTVALDISGNLVITLNSGTAGTAFQEFADAVQGSVSVSYVQQILMHVQVAVQVGPGRGLSHRPQFVHTVQYQGDPGNSSKAMERQGFAVGNRMVPTYLSESPGIITGVSKQYSRNSEVMVDPGSKTVYSAPYKNILIPPLLCRDGTKNNWFGAFTFQGCMPNLSPDGLSTVHPVVDPLSLFYTGLASLYTEVPLELLPRIGLHHTPIIPITNAVFPSGINFFLMSKEGPFGGDTSDWNRNLVSYPAGTPGYYVVTPFIGEVYGTALAGTTMVGQKYTNPQLTAVNGGPFQGIQFPAFMMPARITGVYVRASNIDITPNPPSPFNANRQFIGGIGTSQNLLRDDFDGPTFLLLIDVNGDPTFVLNMDALNLNLVPGTSFATSQFFIECTLFGVDRGFLQTNGRVVAARATGGGSIALSANIFTTTVDTLIGLVTPAPLSFNSTNNQLTVYYSHVPYQGDVFGSQYAYSDDVYRLGPLTIGEANSIRLNPDGAVSSLVLPNKTGFEVLASMNFATSMGTGRLSGQGPLPIVQQVDNPTLPQEYPGTLSDLRRRFSLNRVGYEDWATPKFPVLSTAFATRPALKTFALSEVFDSDLAPEYAGCVTTLPLGVWYRDKDFQGKTLYQSRSSNNYASVSLGVLGIINQETPTLQGAPGNSTWEGYEFICGSSSGTFGTGTEKIIKIDGISPPTSYSDPTRYKTSRGGAIWSATDPWPGGPVQARYPKIRPNMDVGSVIIGTAYLVRSQPESLSGIEVHPGNELQMIVVTQGVPSYFKDTQLSHSGNGDGEGFAAADRYRVFGKPLEKRRGMVDTSQVPTAKPLYVTSITTDPVNFGSSDISQVSMQQETIPVTINGQTVFTLSLAPLQANSVQMYVNGVKVNYGVAYTVAGLTNQIVTYVVSLSNPPLVVTDVIEFWYLVL